ncbi:FAD synthetase family protein [Ureibacillus chungkukjangi]|uniref:FAD synthetase family protein n=1 Tax=Ureibacillus chungkukjangi TaxID=1202712 RepID=UPI00203ECFAC|nr:FAD synthetase family protein [Ureibacillus chungkukjangi]MCM3388943.1 FAD synthetase family protein [Ureibacillus chungkukjangi]
MRTIVINQEDIIHWQARIPNHVIALGFFDGLHKGHKRVILEAKKVANEKQLPLSVMSFFPHPKSVLSKGKVEVDYLMPLEEKQKQLELLGVDYFFVVEFTMEFASLSPQQFIQDYVLGLGATHVVCGYDYTYGKMGAGNAASIATDGMNKLDVSIVSKVDLCGEKISSTRIRELLSDGNVSFISELIGKPYTVEWCAQNGLLPYYTLPSAGQYEVTLTGNLVNEKAIISVINKTEIDYGSIKIPSNDRVTITWHREIRNEKYKAIS